RLVKMEYHDIKERIKTRTNFAFFIEDVAEMAKRNNCVEVKNESFHTESTNRQHTTTVTLFEYMIGNTDWAVPLYRNIKLIRNEEDSSSRPFVVPYDFDYSGMVNAGYAIPVPELKISSVRERKYLGFGRTMGELQAALDPFRTQRKLMDSLITGFAPLQLKYKKEMTRYLNDFFNIVSKEKEIRNAFIYDAKKE
ncbi:MAG: hypothetical protein ABIS01_09320, partial [Ferruginibacter sp.]